MCRRHPWAHHPGAPSCCSRELMGGLGEGPGEGGQRGFQEAPLPAIGCSQRVQETLNPRDFLDQAQATPRVILGFRVSGQSAVPRCPEPLVNNQLSTPRAFLRVRPAQLVRR